MKINFATVIFAVAFFLSSSSIIYAQLVFPILLRVEWGVNPPDQEVTGYIVSVNNITSNVSPTACIASSCFFNFQILNPGPHVVSVRAENIWGVSLASSITFTAKEPGLVEQGTIRIIRGTGK
jgi:hypothetical protein